MRRGVFAVAMVLVLSSLIARAADVSGVWLGEYHTNEGGVFEMTLTVKVDGSALTGTLKTGSSEPEPITEGRVDGAALSFSITRTYRGNPQKVTYKGTVNGEDMKLTRLVGGSSRDFTFTRKK